jgi:thiamine-phosphate pyrophosphorylase
LRGIYAIVNADETPVELARAALDGGIRIVQYRAKRGIVPAHAHALRRLTSACGAFFLLNDDWRAVKDYGADGVHLGPEDAALAALPGIRRALASGIIGYSCGSADEAREAEAAGCDYIGVGSVYATASKDDAGEPIGLDGLRAIAASTRLPVAAIGGISARNLRDVRATGVAMAAVISALSTAEDPRAAARQLVEIWNGE